MNIFDKGDKMKPLTIEQLKALEIGDWVWITDVNSNLGDYARKSVRFDENEFQYETIETYDAYDYSDYGTKWLAYKNKEQAEANHDIVELPCKPNDIVYYVTEVDDGNDIYFTIMNGVVDCFNIETGCKEFLARYDGGLTYWHRFLDFGKEVFTSKSAAEAKLAELKGEKL